VKERATGIFEATGNLLRLRAAVPVFLPSQGFEQFSPAKTATCHSSAAPSSHDLSFFRSAVFARMSTKPESESSGLLQSGARVLAAAAALVSVWGVHRYYSSRKHGVRATSADLEVCTEIKII
jgi:hypothetical protein